MAGIGQSAGNQPLWLGSSETIRRVSDVKDGSVELAADWVVGFVDGEGCFHVSVNRQPGMTIGFQVLPELVVVQHQRDEQVLYALKRFFRAGVVRPNHGDRYCLRIRKLDALHSVCDFFQKHPLKTRKNVDFHKFRRVIYLMSQNKHLEQDGLLEIVDLAISMNTTVRPALQQVRKELMGVG